MIQVAIYTYLNTPVTEITPTSSSSATAALGKRDYGTGGTEAEGHYGRHRRGGEHAVPARGFRREGN